MVARRKAGGGTGSGPNPDERLDECPVATGQDRHRETKRSSENI